MEIYLLHFTKPLERNGHGDAGHYLGSTKHLDERLSHHRNGTGACITRAAVQSGAELELARVWEHPDRGLEQRIKRNNNNPRLCPICNPDTAFNHMRGN